MVHYDAGFPKSVAASGDRLKLGPGRRNTSEDPKALGIASTSYNAILGTHIDVSAGTVFSARSASLDNSNNGGMKFRGTAFDQGFKLAELSDGLSKVPLIAETRERRFASWYDGTMNWIVAARHSIPVCGNDCDYAATNNPTAGRYKALAESRWISRDDGTIGAGGIGIELRPNGG